MLPPFFDRELGMAAVKQESLSVGHTSTANLADLAITSYLNQPFLKSLIPFAFCTFLSPHDPQSDLVAAKKRPY